MCKLRLAITASCRYIYRASPKLFCIISNQLSTGVYLLQGSLQRAVRQEAWLNSSDIRYIFPAQVLKFNGDIYTLRSRGVC